MLNAKMPFYTLPVSWQHTIQMLLLLLRMACGNDRRFAFKLRGLIKSLFALVRLFVLIYWFVFVCRDNLLRLRLSDLSLVEISPWSSDSVTVLVCMSKAQTKVSHFSLLTYSAFLSYCSYLPARFQEKVHDQFEQRREKDKTTKFWQWKLKKMKATCVSSSTSKTFICR